MRTMSAGDSTIGDAELVCERIVAEDDDACVDALEHVKRKALCVRVVRVVHDVVNYFSKYRAFTVDEREVAASGRIGIADDEVHHDEEVVDVRSECASLASTTKVGLTKVGLDRQRDAHTEAFSRRRLTS